MSFTDDCQDTDFRAHLRRSEDHMTDEKETKAEKKEAEKKEADERPIGYFQLDVQELGTEFTATPEGE